MTYYAHKPVAVLTYCFMASVTLPLTVQAKTTFLPDFEEEPIIFPGDCEGGGEDYCLCQRSANPKYHLSLDNPQCPSPKIFDKTCPHSDDWITECYCPATYNKICTSPYRGIGEICDGKYEECCDTRCREGSTSSCSYPYVFDHYSSTGCGETCYVCRYGNDCNTSCSADEITSPSGGYNDFNGQACVTCSTPPPPPPCTECWCDSSYCGPEPEPEPDPEEPDIPNIPDSPDPDPKPDTPSCTDTCSSKGYSSSQPSGQTCSTTTVCGNRCYYNCTTTTPTEPSTPDTPSCTLADCKNTVSTKPSNSSYTTSSCTDCSGSHTINTGWSCNSGYKQQGGACVKECIPLQDESNCGRNGTHLCSDGCNGFRKCCNAGDPCDTLGHPECSRGQHIVGECCCPPGVTNKNRCDCCALR